MHNKLSLFIGNARKIYERLCTTKQATTLHEFNILQMAFPVIFKSYIYVFYQQTKSDNSQNLKNIEAEDTFCVVLGR